MEVSATWLLTIFLVVVIISNIGAMTTNVPDKTTADTASTLFTTSSPVDVHQMENVTTSEPMKTTSKRKFKLDYVQPFRNVKDILMQEIHTLDKDTLNKQVQEEMEDTFKAAAGSDPEHSQRKITVKSSELTTATSKEEDDLKEKKFDNLSSYDEYDDKDEEDDEYDDGDEKDEDDDEDDDDDNDDKLYDDEDVMMQCPDYCKCVGQYAAAMTATCTRLVEEQTFGPGIAHLKIENAGEIRLGPNALLTRGLQQLESITITDTRIVQLDRTAFNGITYLFAVNLTRNDLHDIHPNTFQNNTQLSLLTIANNPLRYMEDSKLSKHLLYAPTVTDFDFSNNGILRLKRNAFSKMKSLNFINLRGNWIRELDSAIFDSLNSLVEVDLADNFLTDLPSKLFDGNVVQTLHISGNGLSTLASVNASELIILDASANKIKAIAKEDLNNMPLLSQLNVRSNNMKRIHQHAFSNIDQLTILDISDNKLSQITEHHFRANPRLQVLLMSDNPGLQTLPVFKTSGLEHNTFSIYRFECANCGLDSLEPGTFDEMPALNRLNLAKNRLSGLPDGLLDRLSSLQELDLSENIISTLQPNMFLGAHSLNKLNLATNPLRTLQVTPFLNTPRLNRLDVSGCSLERVWSEARMPLKTLRYLSVRGNLLRRITVEELRATPALSGLDLSRNPLDCDDEFNEAIQWLTDRGVAPMETKRYINDFANDDTESTGISEWTDLAKTVCDGIEDGPPPRTISSKTKTQLKDDTTFGYEDEDTGSLFRDALYRDEKLLKLGIDHGMRQAEDPRLSEDQEYDEDLAVTSEYHTWRNGALWMSVTIILVTLAILLLVAHIALCLAKKRGRGPVLRPPMILRQGLVDNKNCGLVYKPLQEEIATPHMPKRGSFYSSSTFHYDKIVPESV